MNLKVKFPIMILKILLCRTVVIHAALFAFLIEDSSIFQDCKNEPDYLGVSDFIDLSHLNVELLDDSVHLEGDITMIWDADPNDRVELNSELFKYERGSWQPTVFTMVQKDFCATLFDDGDVWYSSWMQFVDSNDRKCITNKGHTFHHMPFDLETVFDIQGEDISGKHKVVLKIDAFDQQENKQPYSVCIEILGDVIKK